MISFILSTAARFLLPVFPLLSLFLLVRGHNAPGGGFAGGLVAAATAALYVLTHDVEAAQDLQRLRPRTLIGIGLLIAAGSGMWSLLVGSPLMTAGWTSLEVPLLGRVHLGTPLLFDVGVYLVVVGVIVTILSLLAEE